MEFSTDPLGEKLSIICKKYDIKMLLNWLEIQKWTIWPESADQAGCRNAENIPSDKICCIVLMSLILN